MKIRIPPFIKKNDVIGVTAPSFGCTVEPYASRYITAKEIIEEKGYAVKSGETVFKSDGLGISSDPETCAKELEAFYSDSSISAIISAGGGEMMCETAGFIDFDRIAKEKPKWFMGYSDNTNFIYPLVTISRTAGIYGPCISGLGKKWERSETDAFGLLEGKINSVCGHEKFQRPEDDVPPEKNFREFTYRLSDDKILSSFIPEGKKLIKADTSKKIAMEGILLGGCLDVLANLCGTKLDRTREFIESCGNEKIIWIIESCDGTPMEIRRQIWHLKNSSWFSNASGFLVGRPLAAFETEMMGVNRHNAVTDILSDLGIPVIMDCDIGHIDPAMPVVMGAKAEAKIQGNFIGIDFFI